MPQCLNPRCLANHPPGTIQCTNPFCQCLLPEAVLAGRYRIETLLGLGGMGAVYRVYDSFEAQKVALKIIQSITAQSDPTTIERFRREARYAHQLQHKNIVSVLNFGQDGTMFYLVMPLITGGTLKNLLQPEQPLPVGIIQRYLHDLATALDAVHAHPQQIVHRDIKPSNLLIHQDDGRLMLADFGIARAMQEKALTQRGWIVGTEHYIAPEQEHGKAEPASDIYAMGVVAYQMCTGLLPFQAVVRNHAAELPPPSTLNSVLPQEVDAVIQRAMEIEPSKRYRSGQEFVDAFDKALKALSFVEFPTIISNQANANIMVQTLIPENPCGTCGQENRSSSRFCRRCGSALSTTSPLVTESCQVGYVSDIGRRYVAETNEDMLLIVQGLCTTLVPPRPFSLFAVADGLREQQAKVAVGHEASRLVVATVANTLTPRLTTQPHTTGTGNRQSTGSQAKLPPVEVLLEQWLREAVQQANQVIYHVNADFETNMASTLTAALLYKRRLYIASVGDSRAYHFSQKNGLHRITTDHTLGANLVAAQLLTPDELYKSPKRDQHYRILGQSGQIQVDLFQHEVEMNDLILLCTDGLWNMVHDRTLAQMLATGGDPQKLARALVDAANLAGGEGNVSAIVIKVL